MRAACTIVVLAMTTAAWAGPAIVAGGPKRDADRERVAEALDRVAGVLAPCWRGKRPATVRVELEVAADGEIAAAKAETPGKVAACAAAVLAVQALAPAKGGYALTVELPTQGGGTAGASARDIVAGALQGDAALAACRADAGDAEGRVEIRFLVKPDGAVVDVEVVSRKGVAERVASCFQRAVRALRLGELPGSKTIEFVMPFELGGRPAGDAPAAGGGDAALQPSAKGPIPGSVLDEVMKKARAEFTACYDKRAAKNPELAGDVVLRYTVRADGTTRNVKIKHTTLNDAATEACIVGVGEKLRFPAEPGRGETRVVYPFRFSRQ